MKPSSKFVMPQSQNAMVVTYEREKVGEVLRFERNVRD